MYIQTYVDPSICIIHREECSAVCTDRQSVASAVVRGTVTLIPYGIYFGQITCKQIWIPLQRKVIWSKYTHVSIDAA